MMHLTLSTGSYRVAAVTIHTYLWHAALEMVCKGLNATIQRTPPDRPGTFGFVILPNPYM